MSLVAVEFAFFFPAVFLLYWLAPRHRAIQNSVLLVASIVFFASWSLRFIPLLFTLVILDFVAARYLEYSVNADAAGIRRRMVCWLAIGMNVGALLLLKYEGFFASSLNAALGRLGVPALVPVLHFLAPVGLSFYTLAKIGYLVDVYYGRMRAGRSLLDYALFVTFFPQQLAGPVSRAREVLPQLAESRRPQPEAFASGSLLILLGFFAKAYLAPLFARVVDPVFASPDSYDALSHWVSLAGYAGQVFCDFGGYSAVALGVGKLLGIELPCNFRYPFLARNLLEFWRNWHISLTNWLFEYLFVPMTTGGGWLKRHAAIALVIVFVVSGLWHGATWPFVFWGLLQGLGLAVHYWWDERYKQLCRRDRRWVQRRRTRAYGLVAWCLTQLFFIATMLPFRAPTWAVAGRFAAGLIHGGPERLPLLAPHLLLAVMLVALYHLTALPSGASAWSRFLALPAPARGFAYGLVVVFLLLFAAPTDGAFIYAQF